MACPEGYEWTWIDMSSEGRPVDDYIFTTTDEKSPPYIQWHNPGKSRSTKRCAMLGVFHRYGHHPSNCRDIWRNYVCEYEGKENSSTCLQKICVYLCCK